MKILEWINFLNGMRLKGKKVYTLAEIANIDNTTIKSAKTVSQRLKKNNILINIYKNIWAVPEATIYDAAPHLVPDSYCSMETALFHYNLIKQSPQNFHFVSLRLSGAKDTKLGIIYFHKIKKNLYFGFTNHMAEPEKAFLDYLYFCLNGGRKPFADYDFTNYKKFRKRRLKIYAKSYPKSVRRHTAALNLPKASKKRA